MIDLMKEHISSFSGTDVQKQWHHAREFLQVLVLKMMSDEGLFEGCSFVGGTCLRIVFDVRRFSEDLDFSAKGPGIDIQKAGHVFAKHFEEYGIPVEAAVGQEKTVQAIDLRFPQLLYELGLSPLKDQKLRIKWNIDTIPPAGAEYAVTPLMKYGMMFAVDHYDLPSLFAGKLHACLFRPYVKGRDWYDLLWFLGHKTRPNLAQLNNAASQTQDRDFGFTMDSLKGFLIEKVSGMDFKAVGKDVERFLDDPKEVKMFQQEYFTSLIEAMV